MTAKDLPALLKKQPVALSSLLVCLIFAGGAYFRRDALAAVKADLAAKTDEGNRINANVRNSAQLAEQYASITQSTQAIEERLVHAGNLAINLQYFYRLESETQTKLIDLRQNGLSGKKGGYQSVDYVVSAQGAYPQILGFLRQVESGAHYSQIIGLTLSRGGGSETGVPSKTITINLVLKLLGVP